MNTPHNESVSHRTDEFIADGARDVNPPFIVADAGQGDIVYGDRRYVITPRDQAYQNYVALMERANVTYLKDDSGLSDEVVVVGSLPRDGRNLPQVMRSRASSSGLTPNDVFYMLGRDCRRLINANDGNKGLVAVGTELDKIVILREQQAIMFLPSTQEATEISEDNLVRTIGEQLKSPSYARHGAIALMNSFETGLTQ